MYVYTGPRGIQMSSLDASRLHALIFSVRTQSLLLVSFKPSSYTSFILQQGTRRVVPNLIHARARPKLRILAPL